LIRSEDLYPLKAEEIEKGQTIQAVLVFIDAKKDRIRASVKRLERQKERDALKQYSDDSSINSLGELIKK
jgi:small subunit ribosomal protein S1